MRPFLSLICVAALLAGCTTPAEKAREAEAAKVAREAKYDQQCQSYGLKPGTDAYGLCRVQLDDAHERRRDVVRGAVLQHLLAR